jgi:circadian clock protein KaiC
MLMRLIDFLKSQQITAFFTSLTHSDSALEQSQSGISSLIDTWLLLRDIELGGERNRGMYVLKSRGMAHSNQIREFLLTDHGFELKDVYIGPEGVLTGSLRLAQEAREQAAALTRQHEIEWRQRELERKRQALETQIVALRGQFEAEEDELKFLTAQEQTASDRLRQNQDQMARSRKGDVAAETPGNGSRRIAAPRERK